VKDLVQGIQVLNKAKIPVQVRQLGENIMKPVEKFLVQVVLCLGGSEEFDKCDKLVDQDLC